jgi:Tn3 transposase DDE domain
MTRALQQMREEGDAIDLEALATLSPYQTEHVNRTPEPLEQYLNPSSLSQRPDIPLLERSVSF